MLLLLGITFSFFANSQEYQDVIYLKNGSVIKGEIIQRDSDKFIIKTSDFQLYSFNLPEIEQILQEQKLDLAEYGGNFSYGVSLGGGGIIGLPIRFHKGEKFAFEMGLHYRPGIIYADDYWGRSTLYLEHSVVFSTGANFYFGKYFKEKKQKVKLNGLKIMAGAGTGGYDTYLFAIGWINESFKKFNNHKSFSFELGPGFVITDFSSSNSSGYPEDTYSGGNIMVYWKLQWNWFRI